MSEFGDWLAQHPMITFAVPQAAIVTPIMGVTNEGTLLTVNHNVAAIPQNLVGKTVVFSGKRDDAAQTAVEHRGGKVGSAVSKNTSYLVLSDAQQTTGKYVKAQSLGIPIFIIDDFRKQFLS